MKILKLRFKNLNSLAGEWSIDFTYPEYISDGIFSISGPTGAGKSTILDAICLALYGRTPRLKNISKTSNEIMSRLTGICFAEVVFGTDAGRFRAYWSQRRARGMAAGALQEPDHELSEADSGKILSARIKTTRTLIEEKTGMDYDRFVQSMMLAQGGFAAFLQAGGSERAPILEQITGTEIYSNISIHVFGKQRAEKSELEKLIAENKGIILLSSEEKDRIIKKLEETDNLKNVLTTERDKLDAAKKWQENIVIINNELSGIASEEIILNDELNETKPLRTLLQNARRAAVLDGEFASLTALRNQQVDDISVLKGLQLRTPDLFTEMETAKKFYEEADKQYSDTKKANEIHLKLITEVRSLDQSISHIRSNLKTTEESLEELKAASEKEITRKKNLEKSIEALNKETESIELYLKEKNTDSKLITDLEGIREKAAALTESHILLSDATKKLQFSLQSLKTIAAEKEEYGDKVEMADEQHKKVTDNLKLTSEEIKGLLDGKSLIEYHILKDNLIIHIAELKKVADFETERTLLEDDKPCPLCGSLQHPYAKGNIPVSTEAESELARLIILIKEAEKLNERLSVLREKEKESGEKVALLRNTRAILSEKQRNSELTVKEQTEYLNNCKEKRIRQQSAFLKMLGIYGISEIPGEGEGIKKLISSLETRKNTYIEKDKRRLEIDREKVLRQSEIKECTAIINIKVADIEVKVKDLEILQASMNSLTDRRTHIFGEKITDEEEEKSKIELQKSEEARNMARDRFDRSMHNYKENESRITELKSLSGNRQTKLELAEKEFNRHVTGAGFEDEEKFKSNRLPPEEREQLELRMTDLDTRKTSLSARKRDTEKRLGEERSKNLTAEEYDVVTSRLIDVNSTLTVLLQETGALKQKLADDNIARTRGEEIERRIELQTAAFNRWDSLCSLIGSADGRKYRNFAQGLTLEIMIIYANKQLKNLSDRYLLIRDKNEPLELNVIDNYQAGEIRSTKNLSGGESFIVSLALALGLSKMAGRNVRIDSLFLDEGFGTLDEETLETALGTLASLRQDGKMIGVISHVGALKERISTQITVHPVREGRSIISGPGCREIV
jgi:exonuclease SbcC